MKNFKNFAKMTQGGALRRIFKTFRRIFYAYLAQTLP